MKAVRLELHNPKTVNSINVGLLFRTSTVALGMHIKIYFVCLFAYLFGLKTIMLQHWKYISGSKERGAPRAIIYSPKTTWVLNPVASIKYQLHCNRIC